MSPEDPIDALRYRPYEEKAITSGMADSIEGIRKLQAQETAKRDTALSRSALNLSQIWKISISPNSPNFIHLQLIDGKKLTISPRKELAELAPDTSAVYELFAKLATSGTAFAVIPSEFVIQ